MCVLGSQPCATAEPHSQLMIEVLRQEEDLECLVPKVVDELDSRSRLIKVKNDNSLARLDRDGNNYIGSSNRPGNNLGFLGFDGNNVWNTADFILLTVFPWCSVVWLPCTVREPIPYRAVVRGRWDGKPIYMLKICTISGQYEYIMCVIGYPVVDWAVAFDTLIQL